MRYITELEKLHLELDGKRKITREDVKEIIRRTERSGNTDEEFVLLTRKGHKIPGVSKSSIRLPLPVDPEIVWGFETGRFRRIVESWTSPSENSDPVIKVRHHSCSERGSNRTCNLRKQSLSLKRLRGWRFWRMSRNIKIGDTRRLCDHSLYNASSHYLKLRRLNDVINAGSPSWA